jgi:hypothetical protein
MQCTSKNISLHTVIEERVELLVIGTTPAPCVEQLTDALAGSAARDESSLRGIEDWMENENATEAHSEHLAEEFPQAILEANGTHV